MTTPKLKLDLDAVAVTSFATGNTGIESRGTVVAHAKGPCLTEINSCMPTYYSGCETYRCPSSPGGVCGTGTWDCV